jgi:hypothetical protein
MKPVSYFRHIVWSLFLGTALLACRDANEADDAPRLFRPIVSLENRGNSLIAQWDNIADASLYALEIFQVTGEDEAGRAVMESFRTDTVASSPYRLDGLEWDEKYLLRLKAIGNGVESRWYETPAVTIPYPTNLIEPRLIDVAVLARWKVVAGKEITHLRVVPAEGDAVEYPLSAEEYNTGEAAIYGLQPETGYTLYAYSGTEQTAATYEGRLKIKTKASENFDELYGAGNYIDLRDIEDPDVLKSEEILQRMRDAEGLAIILRGGFEYEVDKTIVFEKSVTYATGLSLAGNAVFVQSSAMLSKNDAVIANITFKNIDFISDKAKATPIAATTDKTFGGRQLYNVNGSNSTVANMLFDGCSVQGYRAMIRMQAADEGISNLTIRNSTINGIGDQGMMATADKGGILEQIVIQNTTITNVVMLLDVRKTQTPPQFQITDCTFCYAPIETNANANTPMFRLGDNTAVLTISNCIFGPSMATTNSAGSTLQTYRPGAYGSVMLDKTAPKATISVANSYRTNFVWAPVGSNDPKDTYPLTGPEALPVSETELFTEPNEDNYTIKYTFPGARSAGAIKWRMS